VYYSSISSSNCVTALPLFDEYDDGRMLMKKRGQISLLKRKMDRDNDIDELVGRVDDNSSSVDGVDEKEGPNKFTCVLLG